MKILLIRQHIKRARIGSRAARSTQAALNATMMPIALGQVISSIESLTTSSLYGRKSLIRGVSARNAKLGSLSHAALSILDSPLTPMILSSASLCAALALMAGHGRRSIQIGACTIIGACNRLMEVRSPYGRDGADQMTAVIAQYRTLTALIPNTSRSDDVFLRAVNLQAGLSYFVSGIAKLFGSSWVQGDALGEIVATQAYGGGPLAAFLRRHPRLCRLLTMATPLWEAAFPLVYVLPPPVGRAVLVGVKVFHVGVASVMELPRFIWGFFGSHGAIGYVLDGSKRNNDHLERVVIGAAAMTVMTSAIYASTQRGLDMQRRSGLRGTLLLEMDDGVVEYNWVRPSGAMSDLANAPVVILEAGLGNPLDAWTWVESALPRDMHIISYHRAGYGRTTSRASPERVIRSLIEGTGSNGPLIGVSHSIGSLVQAGYADVSIAGRRLSGIVIVDGTDPDLLAADRSDRRRVGSFLQAQLHTMLSAITGVYNFAPNAVQRQARYEPDCQAATVQFVFSPRTIYRATREYFDISTRQALDVVRQVPNRFVVGSHENEVQQKALAAKVDGQFTLVAESSHRSILGYRHHAETVAAVVEDVVRAST